ILREARLVNDLIDRFEVPAPEPALAPPVNTNHSRPRRLLVVEDHLDTLRAFARILRREGFEVQEATNVADAIAAAREGDFLLSDIALPDGNGCDLMRRLSSLGIPGVAISGYGTAKDREEYKRAGFIESFVKPVDVKQVINVITRASGNGDGTMSANDTKSTANS
ncbi:MAG TPA: response regulator, partial [Chthoniobacterales bacterium]|nr:response regulator [Chthoniobacterales bacterium]